MPATDAPPFYKGLQDSIGNMQSNRPQITVSLDAPDADITR